MDLTCDENKRAESRLTPNLQTSTNVCEMKHPPTLRWRWATFAGKILEATTKSSILLFFILKKLVEILMSFNQLTKPAEGANWTICSWDTIEHQWKVTIWWHSCFCCCLFLREWGRKQLLPCEFYRVADDVDHDGDRVGRDNLTKVVLNDSYYNNVDC